MGVHFFSSPRGHLTTSRDIWGLPGGSAGKNPPANAADAGSVPGPGRSPRGGNGNPLQYPCLEKPKAGGAWHAAVHGVTKSWT